MLEIVRTNDYEVNCDYFILKDLGFLLKFIIILITFTLNVHKVKEWGASISPPTFDSDCSKKIKIDPQYFL
ncbi:hypothetical protein EBR43_04765 [bacterium]|nr:hypothetical protein [bacterium]NBX71444.1 hypothetical protein [bacterium]